MYACIGDSVTLPWGYTAQDGETVEDIKWYFDPQNGSHVGIAVTMEGQFFPLTSPFSNRIRQVQEAGLLITSLTGSDRGNYFVTATVLRGSTFAVYNSTVSLRLSESKKMLFLCFPMSINRFYSSLFSFFTTALVAL